MTTKPHEMEKRIRFGSDGNGTFVAVSADNGQTWRLFEDEKEFHLSPITCRATRYLPNAEFQMGCAFLRGDWTPGVASKVYTYRNLPCNILPEEDLWCVSGSDSKGRSGVLEWCWNEGDARAIMAEMQLDFGRFSRLKVSNWYNAMNGHEASNQEKPNKSPEPDGFPMDCDYCHGIGACPKCWGRAAITRLEKRS